MFDSIKKFVVQQESEFESIPSDRKVQLEKLSTHITSALLQNNLPINLTYICTHNSRRSHFGQIAAALAASYYRVKNIQTFSGGTEVTAFNLNAINALKSIGFNIAISSKDDTNPTYTVKFSQNSSVLCFSKIFDDHANPQENFIAILTCSSADAGCPFIPGASLRISTPYEDPTRGDGQENVNEIYLETFAEIVRDTLYVFSKVSL